MNINNSGTDREKSIKKLDSDFNSSLNSNSNNNNDIDIVSGNSLIMKGENDESMPSFGFTQEQVACVCEVNRLVLVLKKNYFFDFFTFHFILFSS